LLFPLMNIAANIKDWNMKVGIELPGRAEEPDSGAGKALLTHLLESFLILAIGLCYNENLIDHLCTHSTQFR
jgi:hypothetical protein